MRKLNQMEKETLERAHFIPIKIDAAYINALVDLVNACREEGVEIDTVSHFQSGWHVTFKGFKSADAICHDHSYGSPNYMTSFLGKENPNDWSRNGAWETIGFPWDGDDVSVHSAEELAHYIYCLKMREGRYYFRAPWENENEDE